MNALLLFVSFFLSLTWTCQISASELDLNGKSISAKVKSVMASFDYGSISSGALSKSIIDGLNINISGYIRAEETEKIRSSIPNVPINYSAYGFDYFQKIGSDHSLTVHASSQTDARSSVVYGAMAILSHSAITIDLGTETSLFSRADFEKRGAGLNSVCYSVYDHLMSPSSGLEVGYMVIYSDAIGPDSGHELINCLIAQANIFNALQK